MTDKIQWIFFDVGTTLVDETKAYEHRIKDAIAGTDISFDVFREKRIFAKKLGMTTVWVRQGFSIYRSPVSEEYEADYTIDDLTGLKNIF